MLAELGWGLLGLSLLGAGYTFASGLALGWFYAQAAAPDADCPPVTILKPLHGDEPDLLKRLGGFCSQDYPAPVQIVFGVRDRLDPAVEVVRQLMRRHPGVDIQMVVDDRVYGANLKISNLVNMELHARHAVLVVADSDVSVTPDYLRQLTAALAPGDIGYATCAFVGVPTGNAWSHLAAMAINHHFLPSVAFGLRLKLAKPCFGPTMAFRRTVLHEAGGFIRFADRLADDFEIGRAIRDLGYSFAIPNLLIGHACPERSARRLVGHEMRWAKTIRLIDPCAYAGSLLCHPLICGLLATVALHGALASVGGLATVFAARLFVMARVGRLTGCGGPFWLAPARELLSAAIYVWAYVGDTVSWRDRRFRVSSKGVLIAHARLATVSASPRVAVAAAADYLPAAALVHPTALG